MLLKHKRAVLLFTLLLLVSISYIGEALEIKEGPYLQNVTEDSITIMWRTSKPATSTVMWGEKDSVFEQDEVQPRDLRYPDLDEELTILDLNTIHEVTITDLTKERAYFYKVASTDRKEEVRSNTNNFKTAPGPDTPFKFVVYGDSQGPWEPGLREQHVNQMIAHAPDLVLCTGDAMERGLEEDQWQDQHLYPMRNLMNTVPSYVAPGNHEEDSPFLKKYLSQPGNHHWFAFSYGNSRFIVLDSNSNFPSRSFQPGSEQYEWLKEELASKEYEDSTWRFAFFHHPPYSNIHDHYQDEISAQVREYLVPLLEDAGVHIVFTGHIHRYETAVSLDPKIGGDTIHVISGGGGGSLYTGVDDVWPNAMDMYIGYNFSIIEVCDQEVRLQTESVYPAQKYGSKTGEIIDEILLIKDEEPKIEYKEFQMLEDSESHSVKANEEFSMEITLKNSGKVIGAEMIEILNNGELLEEQYVTLKPGEERVIHISTRLFQPGENHLTVSDLPPVTMEVEAVPATFEYSTLTRPNSVYTGDEFTISALVQNVGSFSDTESVHLYHDGESIVSKEITLDPGEKKDISFVKTLPADIYRLSIGDLEPKQVVVGERPEDIWATYASTEAYFYEVQDSIFIDANGIQAWTGSDEYGALYLQEKVEGDFTAIVKVVSQQRIDVWSQAGIIVRNDITRSGESLGYVAKVMTPEGGWNLYWDSTENGHLNTSHRRDRGDEEYPTWLKLEKEGTTFTGYYSLDGEHWNEVGSAQVPSANERQHVGLTVTAYSEDLCITEFKEFELINE